MDPRVVEELNLIRDFLSVLRVAFVELAGQVDSLKADVIALHGQYQALGQVYGGEEAIVDEGFGPESGSYL